MLCWLVLCILTPGLPFDSSSAWCLVCELCRATVVWVHCRCFLSWAFLAGASGSFLRVTLWQS